MMSLLLYLMVLLVSASSVLFGMGWLAAPEPHYRAPPVQMAHQVAPATSKADGQLSPIYRTVVPDPAAAAKPKTASEPPPAASAKTAVASRPPDVPAKNAVAAAPPPATSAPAAAAPTTVQTDTAAAPPPPACDIRACAAAYNSFRASDCTYQPYDGPRRLCTKGMPPARTQAKPAAAGVPVEAQAQAARAQAPACNVAACEAAYRSFDPSDCTYQPYNGPRRICTK